MRHPITLTVNGERLEIAVDPDRSLLSLLRDDLGLTGVKDACASGDCGACTVLLDGKPINSCVALAASLDGHSVQTVEALVDDLLGSKLQKAFVEHGAVQCGYCTPGMLMSAKALLSDDPSPSRDEIASAMAGNICRCTGYLKIIEAIEAVSADLEGAK